MVIIQGEREEFDDVDRVPQTSKAIAEKYEETRRAERRRKDNQRVKETKEY
jgi:hypothetical protein